jgi:hypothetical protein
MWLRRSALVLAISGGSLVVACGFTDVGALDVGAEGGASSGPNAGDSGTTGADGASTGDGSNERDGSTTGIPICNPATCALPSPPAGWDLVLLGASRADACPAGFDSSDAIESPSPGANACTCGACVTAGTNCFTGMIPTQYDDSGGACGTVGGSISASGTCQSANGALGQHASATPPPAVKGTCTSASAPAPASVVSQLGRVCTLQAGTCNGVACGAPPSMKACIGAPGDVACPIGTKHLVGSDVALACPPCGCTIASATCGGTLEFYSGSNCSGTVYSLTSTCKQTNGVSVQTAKWKGVVATEVCATTPVAPTVTLTSPQTICCP